MFVRFSRRNGDEEAIYSRAVAINNTYLMQRGNDIVAYAYLSDVNREKDVATYTVCISREFNEEITDSVERYIKRFIGNSATWEGSECRRRRYNVTYVAKFDKDNFKIILS